jgi:predicted transcriptional regulator of viral defense system
MNVKLSSQNNSLNLDSLIMNLIVDNELSVFNIETLVSLSGKQYVDLKPVLKKLVANEQLSRIEKGLYCVRNFRNPYVIANNLLPESVIAYWSALNLHQLTEQIPNVIYSQSVIQKKDTKVFNVRYKFVTIKQAKFTGISNMGFGNEIFKITDVEKTLLDCFDQPQHSGGYEELIRAMYNAKINCSKLIAYGMQLDNLSILKRIAFLSELFEMTNLSKFRSEVLKLVNKRYTLLDPLGANLGSFNSKWKIRVNIPQENLLSIINKMY